MSVTIEDGVYFLHPEGGAWIAARFGGGRFVAATEESLATTHRASNDSWAGVEPADDDRELAASLADAIVRAVEGDDADPSCYVVTGPHPWSPTEGGPIR